MSIKTSLPILVLAAVIYWYPSNAQDSYQLRSDSLLRFESMMVNEENETQLFFSNRGYDYPHHIFFIPFDGTVGFKTGWEIGYAGVFKLQQVDVTKMLGNRVYWSHSWDALATTIEAAPYGAISSLDLTTGEYWSKKVYSYFSEGPVVEIDSNGDAYLFNLVNDQLYDTLYPLSGVTEMYHLDSSGEEIWRKAMVLCGNLATFCAGLARGAAFAPNGDIYVSGILNYGFGLPFWDEYRESFILRMDTDGNILQKTTIEGYSLNKLLVTGDGIYLMNKGVAEKFEGYDPEEEYLALIKLDFDLNFLWGKKYYADQYRYASGEFVATDDGRLVVSHATKGFYPAILSELDWEGNILSEKGYPNHSPKMKVFGDGSLLLGSRSSLDATGNYVAQAVIAKTDAQGDIEGCETFNTCLRSEDIPSIIMGELGVELLDARPLNDRELEVQPFAVSFSEYCDYPSFPNPEFHFPDTLCLADSARTTDTDNRFANAFEWHLSGPGVDSIITDSFDFAFRFFEAGEYNLKHTVWVLGCAYESEKTVTVLPELEINITPETICPEGPQELSVFSDRILREYIWVDGSTSHTLPIDTAGIYSVHASDGFCTASDTAAILFLENIIGPNNPIEIPADTTVCEITLPYLLKIKSGFTDVFSINNDSIFNGEYLINTGGNYLISTEIDGCHFSKSFKLGTSNCQVSIYFPNIFSPNDDGINDEFFPQGNDFETVSLKVFDRWGGLRFDGSGSLAKWTPGKEVAEGAYVYLLEYKNALTGETEQASGEVVLIR